MVADGHFRKETRSAIDGGGVSPHTQRAIPGPSEKTDGLKNAGHDAVHVRVYGSGMRRVGSE